MNNSNGDDYNSRVEIFKRNCDTFRSEHRFLLDAITLLFEMPNETMFVLSNDLTNQEPRDSDYIRKRVSNFTLEDIGIDSYVAQNDFNITDDELHKTVQSAKANVSSDAYFIDAESYPTLASTMLEVQIDEVLDIPLIPHWINAMNNNMTEYFDSSVCVSFFDCTQYSVSQLYEILTLSNENNNTEALQALSVFENLFLNLTSDFSQKIPDIFYMTTELQNQLEELEKNNIFCSIPPTMQSLTQNQTVFKGEEIDLLCDVVGDPLPAIQWYKDNELIVGHTSEILFADNVSVGDSGVYHCVASNIVASLTLPVAHVSVKGMCSLEEPFYIHVL